MANISAYRAAQILSLLLTMFLNLFTSAQEIPKNTPIRFLALGDSYTIGESVSELQRWPVQLAHAFRRKGIRCTMPEIVAVTGWRTDQLRDAILQKEYTNDFNLVSLLIGVNNQYQGRTLDTYREEFQALLEMAVELAGDDKSRVFVLSIPDYGYTPFGAKDKDRISKEIDAFNNANREITEAFGLRYVNITDISRRGLQEPDLVAEDGLHPSDKMYGLWVERILEIL